jgi:hypothetical protein
VNCDGTDRTSHHAPEVDRSNAMRYVLTLGLLIALCGFASAATVRHPHPRHHAGFRHSFGYVVPSPVHYDDAPSYRDPSKFGGGAP